MNHDDRNPSAAAPVRARTEDHSAPALEPPEAVGNRNGAEAGPAPDGSVDRSTHNFSPEIPGQAEPIQQVKLSSNESADLSFDPPAHGPKFQGNVPDDLRVPWGWKDLLFFVFFGFVGLLVAWTIVVFITVEGFHVPFAELTGNGPSTARPLVAILSQGLWSGYVLVYFYLLARARSKSAFWPLIGWRKFQQTGESKMAPVMLYLGIGAIMAVVASIVGRFIGQQRELPIEQMFHSRAAIALLMVFGILVAPLIEETMFRGFLYPVLARRLGVTTGVVVTGVLFGAMHAQQLWGGPGQIGLLIMVGIFLTWIRARAGTVAASYLVHLGYNGLLFLGFFAATGGLQNIPGTR